MLINPQQNIETRVLSKAKEDPEFNQRLLINAKEVFEQELGQRLPESLQIEALQQSPQKLYILLPMAWDELAQSQMLSEEELEAVSGGGSPAVVSAVTAVSKLVVDLTGEYNCLL